MQSFQDRVRFVRSYSPEDYLRVLNSSFHVIGNSSSFIRECSYLAVPALVVGERQRSREIANNVRLISLKEVSSGGLMSHISSLPSKDSLTPSTLYTQQHAGNFIASVLSTPCQDIRKKPMSLLWQSLLLHTSNLRPTFLADKIGLAIIGLPIGV